MIAWTTASILALSVLVVAASAEAGAPRRGEQIGAWTIVHVTEHPEFLRLRLSRGAEVTEIEFTSRSVSGAEEARAQPAPQASPPPELLAEASAWMAARGAVQFTTIHPVVGAESIACGRVMPGGRTVPPLWSVLLASAWLFVVALVLAVRLSGALAGAGRAAYRETLVAAAVGLTTAAVSALATGQLGPNTDTIRDLAIGLECRSGLQCLCGAHATHAGLWQGTLWPRFVGLFASERLENLSVALLACDALAAAILFAFVRRWSGVALGIGAVALWASLSVASGELWIPWNPSLLPLTGVLFAVGAAWALRRPSFLAMCAAGAAAALLVESHAVALGIVGAWLALAASRARWLPLAAACAATGAALHWLLSPGSVLSNVATLTGAWSDLGHPPWLVVLCLVALGLTALVRSVLASRLRARGATEAALAALRVELGAWCLAVVPTVAGGVVATAYSWWLAPRYLLPASGVLVVALTRSATRLPGRGRAAAAVALVVVSGALLATGARAGWADRALALRVVDEISEALDALPPSMDAFEDVHSKDPRLVSAIAAARNHARDQPTRTQPALRLTLDWDFRTEDSGGGSERLVRSELREARVDRSRGLVCASDGVRCTPVTELRRALPMAPIRSTGTLLDSAPPGLAARFRFPVSPSPAPTRLTLFERRDCVFGFGAAEGFEPGELSESSLTIPATTGEAWIVVEVPGGCVPEALPTWVEEPSSR